MSLYLFCVYYLYNVLILLHLYNDSKDILVLYVWVLNSTVRFVYIWTQDLFICMFTETYCSYNYILDMDLM